MLFHGPPCPSTTVPSHQRLRSLLPLLNLPHLPQPPLAFHCPPGLSALSQASAASAFPASAPPCCFLLPSLIFICPVQASLFSPPSATSARSLVCHRLRRASLGHHPLPLSSMALQPSAYPAYSRILDFIHGHPHLLCVPKAFLVSPSLPGASQMSHRLLRLKHTPHLQRTQRLLRVSLGPPQHSAFFAELLRDQLLPDVHLRS